MRKIDLDGLRGFLDEHKFSRFTYIQECQDWFDRNRPDKLTAEFSNITIFEQTGTVQFHNGESKLQIRRPDGISFSFDEVFKSGVITIRSSYLTKGGKRERTYTIFAA